MNYLVVLLADPSTPQKRVEVKPANGTAGAILLYNVEERDPSDWPIMADLCRKADEEYKPVWQAEARKRKQGVYLYHAKLCDVSGYHVVHVPQRDPNYASPYFGVSTHHDGVPGTIFLYNVDPNNPADWPIMAEMCWQADHHYSHVWKDDINKQGRPCEELELPSHLVAEEVELFLRSKSKPAAPQPSGLEKVLVAASP